MYLKQILVFTSILLWSVCLSGQSARDEYRTVSLEWSREQVSGEIDVSHGTLDKMEIFHGKGNVNTNRFKISAKQTKLSVSIAESNISVGPEPTAVHVTTDKGGFSFFLRDVNINNPIYIPDCNVVVLASEDKRSYTDVESSVKGHGNQTKLQKIEAEPEVTFESVSHENRNMSVPIWLGVSRDMRMFEVSEELEDRSQEGKIIKPMYASSAVEIPDADHRSYIYALGRGVGVKNNINRWLDEGVLPIYHSEMLDDDVRYHTTSFVSFAETTLTAATNKGTHYVISDKHSYGRTFKEEHLEEVEEKMKTAYSFDDAMVLYARTNIENTGSVPRYAWIKAPRPGTGWWYKKIHEYNDKTGLSSYGPDRVFCVSLLNGVPLPSEEISILLQPGEKVTYDIFMPHTPISNNDAIKLKSGSFDQKLKDAKEYWKGKLGTAASIKLPEKRIDAMMRAGLLHLDLVTFGEEPNGTVSANIGVYSPIGTESSPIIQFYLSMGWFNLAKRALNYFLETQLSTGYIQNYEGYTVETGAALWSMGEYIRYTDDMQWLNRSKEKILKSCDYLIQWRNRNKSEQLKGRGYGMIEGKVADPEDHYHQFMLNGYGYLGLSRIAEIFKSADPAVSARIQKEAEKWKQDILQTVENLWSLSPVVPLGDGRWVPTLPPWAEANGPRALFQQRETFWSHGTFTAADAMLGPLYLVFCEVIAPESPKARTILDYHSEIFYQGNAAFSQPYYSRHNWLQARLGMVKPFLSTYYNTLSAHADRQTYTFWEHMYRVSPHKTHEEAWFLMETRWMLYMESGDTLNIFKTIPRDWLKEGQVIELQNVKSYFGSISVSAQSHVANGWIEASIDVDPVRKPEVLTIRLPHPENKHPVKVVGGSYHQETETITIDSVTNNIKVKLEY